MLGLKLNHVSKRGPRRQKQTDREIIYRGQISYEDHVFSKIIARRTFWQKYSFYETNYPPDKMMGFCAIQNVVHKNVHGTRELFGQAIC